MRGKGVLTFKRLLEKLRFGGIEYTSEKTIVLHK